MSHRAPLKSTPRSFWKSPWLFYSLFVLCTASDLSACAVCFDAKEGTREAFLWTTLFLSLIPLAMIAGGIFALKHFQSKQASTEAQD